MTEFRVVLASSSPRRRELLKLVGIEHEVRPSNIDETMRPGEAPHQRVRRIQAASHTVMSFQPTDAVEAMFAGHCVIFH